MGDVTDMFGVGECVMLKIGCRILLVANQQHGENLYNGAMGELTGVDVATEELLVRMDGSELIQRIGRYPFRVGPLRDNRWQVCFVQYPVLPGYALTVHKSQGMTVARVHVGSDLFECGHFYVAVSRAVSLQGLTLQEFGPHLVRMSREVIEFYDGCNI
jgi:ATP-dependent exoDNAse (exonuclease V) alpha subunit